MPVGRLVALLALVACADVPRCEVEGGWPVCTAGARLPAIEGGWRCAAGRCRPRRALAGAWSCAGDQCRQPWPRMPDTGEWECTRRDGPALCRRGEPAAGVLALADPGWRCGERRGHAGERVCVDAEPDVPDPARGWRCHYERMSALVCVAAAPAPGPAAPLEPECWLDEDCGADARCAAGRCA